jgi:hypothetical protein
MKASEFLNSGVYIKTEDVKNKPFKAQIVGTTVVNRPAEGARREESQLVLILDVNGEERNLGLNKTNLRILISGFGDDVDTWIGKYIAVDFDPSVTFGTKATGGMRIKVPGQKTKAERALEAQRAAEVALDSLPEAPMKGSLLAAVPEPTVEDDDSIPF